MVYDFSYVLLDSVCHYFIEDFCFDVQYGDWPVVLLFGCVLLQFWDEYNTGFIEELGSILSLSISWKSLRRVGISSFLKV
jgi:hypothetical protein